MSSNGSMKCTSQHYRNGAPRVSQSVAQEDLLLHDWVKGGWITDINIKKHISSLHLFFFIILEEGKGYDLNIFPEHNVATVRSESSFSMLTDWGHFVSCWHWSHLLEICVLVMELKQWQKNANKPHSEMKNIKSKKVVAAFHFTLLCDDDAVRILWDENNREGRKNAHMPKLHRHTRSTPGRFRGNCPFVLGRLLIFLQKTILFTYLKDAIWSTVNQCPVRQLGASPNYQLSGRMYNIFWKGSKSEWSRERRGLAFGKDSFAQSLYLNQYWQRSHWESWCKANSSKTIWRKAGLLGQMLAASITKAFLTVSEGFPLSLSLFKNPTLRMLLLISPQHHHNWAATFDTVISCFATSVYWIGPKCKSIINYVKICIPGRTTVWSLTENI